MIYMVVMILPSDAKILGTLSTKRHALHYAENVTSESFRKAVEQNGIRANREAKAKFAEFLVDLETYPVAVYEVRTVERGGA